jgi:vitamin B12 transporter
MRTRRTAAAPLLSALLLAVSPALRATVAEPPIEASAGQSDDERVEPPTDSPAEEPSGLTVEEEIVVTAARVPEPAHEVGSSVTVIDRAEIERRKVTSVLELLRGVPGLEVAQSGGPGRTASVFLRGANSEHTLVLLDGLRLNNPAFGGFDFADLTLDNVERIEVLRGPQSVLYGSEAMGGVVSIITRRGAEGLSASVEVEGGSLGLRALRAAARGGVRRLEYSVAASNLETEGVSAASERQGNTEDDAYENLTVSGRAGLRWGGDGRADFTARYLDAETGLDGFTFGLGPTDDLNYVQRRDLAQVSLGVTQPLTSWWRQELTVGTVEDHTVGEDPDTPFQSFEYRTRVSELSTRADLRLPGRDRLLVGYAFERREADSAGAFDESLELSSFFANNRWSWRDRLYLTAGVRHDDYSRFGSETTYRATGAWLWPQAGTRLHGSFGTGFRVPSFNELFFPGAGNPGLGPEASEGLDAGVEQTFAGGRLRFDLTYFDNRFEDLIVFDLTRFTFANVAEAESRGVELTVDAAPSPDWDLLASWTYDETEDLASGQPLARRPEHRGTLVASYRPTDRWQSTASVIAVADRIDSDGTPMDEYERVDLAVEYRLGGHLRPYARVENLLDRDYEEVTGFTTPGRVVVLGLRGEL